MSSRNSISSLVAACVLAIVVSPCQPAAAESLSGSDSRPTINRVFAATSPYYRELPTKTPKASTSKKLVASLNSQAHKFYGTKSLANVNVNTNRFAPALYVAYDSDPVFDVQPWNCQYKKAGWDVHLDRQLRNVHIPADLQPDPSTDGSVSIYNADTKELVELWKTRQVDGQWQACWGGRISEADQADGRFTSSFGASASGLALWGVTIRQQELLDGHIDHVVGLALPYTKKGTVSWPASRTDGRKTGTQLAIGQMLRLPANLDLTKMKLSPAAMTIARAAQQYGVVVADTSGSVAFSAENPIALATNSYDTVFRGRWPYLEMAGNKGLGEMAFPLNKLVALPLNYHAPVASAGAEVSPK